MGINFWARVTALRDFFHAFKKPQGDNGLATNIYYFPSILELNLGPDETFIWDLDFPDFT